ncbi:hypothetical protein [Neobacillus bataviensis]
MATSWIKDKGTWYYLNQTGAKVETVVLPKVN